MSPRPYPNPESCPMSLPDETRLAMLGLSEADLTPGLCQVVTDWSERCERLTRYAKDHLDPYDTPFTARVSPFGPVRAEATEGFTLRKSSLIGQDITEGDKT